MKDTIRLILELLKLGRSVYKAYRRAKDAKRKEKIVEAVRSRNLSSLRRLILH